MYWFLISRQKLFPTCYKNGLGVAAYQIQFGVIHSLFVRVLGVITSRGAKLVSRTGDCVPRAHFVALNRCSKPQVESERTERVANNFPLNYNMDKL